MAAEQRKRRARRTVWAAAAAAILALGAVLFPLAGFQLRDNAVNRLERLEQGERYLDSALLAAVNAESGLRGYVITEDRAFLAPYESGSRAFVEHMAGAMRSSLDNERLLAALDVVADDMEAWMAAAGRPEVAAVEQGRAEDARAWASSGIGKRLFDGVRAHTNAALIVFTEEQQLANDHLNRATWLMVVLGLLGLFCAFGVVAIVVHQATAYQMERERHGATQVQLTEARILGKQRADLLAAASHDLRNPLGAIVLAADVLKDGARETGDDELAMLADHVAAAAQRTAMLVSDLLDFARVEAGRLVIERSPVDPLEVVNEAIADLRLWRPGQPVEVDTGAGLVPRVEGDPKRLRAAIRNLLENACQYGEAPYRVRLLGEDGIVEIHVEDAGPGIPEEERHLLFEQFRRGSTASGRDGTGIGLYVCRGIVEQHGGKIEIEDSPLGGSDFVCRVPVVSAA